MAVVRNFIYAKSLQTYAIVVKLLFRTTKTIINTRFRYIYIPIMPTYTQLKYIFAKQVAVVYGHNTQITSHSETSTDLYMYFVRTQISRGILCSMHKFSFNNSPHTSTQCRRIVPLPMYNI